MQNKLLLLLSSLLICSGLHAQVLTREDSLSAGLIAKDNQTVISGYGEAVYSQNFTNQTATASLRRAVLFVGHRFSSKISLFTELELEDALVAGDNDSKGEIAMEQAFLKFDLSPNAYINAGLFIPRIGIINENHLPNTYNGNDRPVVETMIIPTTWREIGVSINGVVPALPGLNYTLGIFNGLDASKFNLATGLEGGRFEGSLASARNKAVTGSLLYYTGPYRLQVSSYVGGSVGLDNKTADRLGLNTGFFGTPVFLNEANVQMHKKGWSFRVLGTIVNIPDADKINAAFANNTPTEMLGAYGEIAYDLLSRKNTEKQLIAFTRYEYVDMNGTIPKNGVENDAYTQHHIFAGINYLPIRNVVIKLDYHFMSTGDYNYALIVNPDPYAQPWYTAQHTINLGVAYSF
jgi:hypothetical protein